ncbi:MAG: DUF1330 domain-containing protein [Bacteroidales bacterium]|nr:DUF1330 domain-containing protein [Bacteroidales bacterium]
MSVYFVANILICNDQEYQFYLDRVEEIFARYKGRYLAVDNSPEVLEGEWKYSRAVLIRFDKQADFDAWYRSDEYKEILKYRLAASECDTILMQGS